MAFLWFLITAMALATVCLIAFVLWREHAPQGVGTWQRDAGTTGRTPTPADRSSEQR